MASADGPTPRRVAIYARTSTRDQSANLQVDELEQVCAHRGWLIVERYQDEAQSGASDRRPRLDDLMRDATGAKFDIVLCWRFDRFARSVRHLVVALDEFRSLGVDFVSVRDGIDTSTPAGRFTFHVIAAVAELERELIRERTRAGLAAARRRGKKLGRPRVEVDLETAIALRSEGATIREVASRLGIARSTLHAALRAGAPPSEKRPAEPAG